MDFLVTKGLQCMIMRLCKSCLMHDVWALAGIPALAVMGLLLLALSLPALPALWGLGSEVDTFCWSNK